MVALVESGREARIDDVTRTLQEAGLPGETFDHRWMAERLVRIVEKLPPEETLRDMEGLLTAGLLRNCGLAASSRDWPEPLLHAVPPLLQSGFPAGTWALVHRGLLQYQGEPWGDAPRWRLDGHRIAPLLGEWHELGEYLVFRTLARGLLPLVNERKGALQIGLSGVGRREGRRWLRVLRNALEDCGAAFPHLILL